VRQHPAVHPDPPAGHAAILVEKVVEWSDTDATGHVHNGFAGRLLEAAEGELLSRLGLAHLMRHMPRVRLVLEYHRRLWFGDRVLVELRMRSLGRTSLTWEMVARAPGGEPAITAEAVVVHAPGESSAPWPEEARAGLTGAGHQGTLLQVDGPPPG
jgi:acyl-CoA thioester hydrolase